MRLAFAFFLALLLSMAPSASAAGWWPSSSPHPKPQKVKRHKGRKHRTS